MTDRVLKSKMVILLKSRARAESTESMGGQVLYFRGIGVVRYTDEGGLMILIVLPEYAMMI